MCLPHPRAVHPAARPSLPACRDGFLRTVFCETGPSFLNGFCLARLCRRCFTYNCESHGIFHPQRVERDFPASKRRRKPLDEALQPSLRTAVAALGAAGERGGRAGTELGPAAPGDAEGPRAGAARGAGPSAGGARRAPGGQGAGAGKEAGAAEEGADIVALCHAGITSLQSEAASARMEALGYSPAEQHLVCKARAARPPAAPRRRWRGGHPSGAVTARRGAAGQRGRARLCPQL